MSKNRFSCALCGERFAELADFQMHHGLKRCPLRRRRTRRPRDGRIGDQIGPSKRRELRRLAAAH